MAAPAVAMGLMSVMRFIFRLMPTQAKSMAPTFERHVAGVSVG